MLYGFDVPTDFVTTSATPRLSKIARIGPPGMMPVPAARGRRGSPPAPPWPRARAGGETEALPAFDGLGDAVEVDELPDQLLATVLVVTPPAAIVAASAATASVTTATASAATTAAARPASVRLLGLGLLNLLLLGLRGSGFSHCRGFDRVGVG